MKGTKMWLGWLGAVCLVVCWALSPVRADEMQDVEMLALDDQDSDSDSDSDGDSDGDGGGVGEVVVWVDCDSGGSVGEALKTPALNLVVEIRGICHENVEVNRDDVVLRGADPALDGLRGAGLAGGADEGVLEVRRANDVDIENLQFSGGGGSGISLHNAYEIGIHNCWSFDHVHHGLAAFNSMSVDITDTTLGPVSRRGLSVFSTPNVQCHRCTIEAGESGVLAAAAAVVSLRDGTVSSGSYSLASSAGSSLVVSDTTMATSATYGVVVDSHSQAYITRSQFNGALFAGVFGHIGLIDSIQTVNSAGFNFIDSKSMIRTSGSSSIQGLLFISGFSDLLLQAGSAQNGDLFCARGGDAFCDDRLDVTGSSNCSQCM